MPPLPDPDATILPATWASRARRARPSPSHDGLALEVVTGREAAYLGQIVGVDVPLVEGDSGFGEPVPINTGPAQP